MGLCANHVVMELLTCPGLKVSRTWNLEMVENNFHKLTFIMPSEGNYWTPSQRYIALFDLGYCLELSWIKEKGLYFITVSIPYCLYNYAGD